MTPPILLPELRQDLQLLRAAPATDGTQQWLIYDPLQHRFIAIDRTAYVLCSIWKPTLGCDELIDQAWHQFGETLDATEFQAFARFLHASSLTVEAPEGGWRFFAAADARRHGSLGSRLMHNYLFFRIPLVAPDGFLRWALPCVRWLGNKSASNAIAVIGLLGLYLVARDWTNFIAAASELFSIEGAALVAATLFVVKAIHELAHAFVATSFGCRVPVIGVAFMMGVPMLYCDVTDAWRLTQRRQRIMVDAAGVAAELAIACCATLLWSFLPFGPIKSLMLTLATTSWLMSVAINLNPFMRFDGYHIAGDLLGVENLQARSFALGRWRMRRVLFGLNLRPPEIMPIWLSRGLTLYAWATWLYRLILFTGIALAVYHYFFKLAGVILFLVEIIYFVAGPIISELTAWWLMRRQIRLHRRSAVTATVVIGLILMAMIPWSGRVHVAAVLEAQEVTTVFAPEAAVVTVVHVTLGMLVAAGQPLVTLEASSLTHALLTTDLKLSAVRLRLARRTADEVDREDTRVLLQEELSLKRRREGLLVQRADLIVKAPISGVAAEINPAVHPGRSLGHKEPLLLLRSQTALVAQGYLSENDVWRVSRGAPARFIAETGTEPAMVAEIMNIGLASATALDRPELVSLYGGPVLATIDMTQRAIPAQAAYAVTAQVKSGELADQTRRGVLVIEGVPESFLARTWRHVMKILVRESGM